MGERSFGDASKRRESRFPAGQCAVHDCVKALAVDASNLPAAFKGRKTSFRPAEQRLIDPASHGTFILLIKHAYEHMLILDAPAPKHAVSGRPAPNCHTVGGQDQGSRCSPTCIRMYRPSAHEPRVATWPVPPHNATHEHEAERDDQPTASFPDRVGLCRFQRKPSAGSLFLPGSLRPSENTNRPQSWVDCGLSRSRRCEWRLPAGGPEVTVHLACLLRQLSGAPALHDPQSGTEVGIVRLARLD